MNGLPIQSLSYICVFSQLIGLLFYFKVTTNIHGQSFVQRRRHLSSDKFPGVGLLSHMMGTCL